MRPRPRQASRSRAQHLSRLIPRNEERQSRHDPTPQVAAPSLLQDWLASCWPSPDRARARRVLADVDVSRSPSARDRDRRQPPARLVLSWQGVCLPRAKRSHRLDSMSAASITTPGVRAISTWQVSPSGSRKLSFGKVQSSTLMAGSRSQAARWRFSLAASSRCARAAFGILRGMKFARASSAVTPLGKIRRAPAPTQKIATPAPHGARGSTLLIIDNHFGVERRFKNPPQPERSLGNDGVGWFGRGDEP